MHRSTGSAALRDELEKLARQEAELASSIETALAGDHLDEKSVAQLLRARCSATRDGLTLIFQRMDQLERRIRPDRIARVRPGLEPPISKKPCA